MVILLQTYLPTFLKIFASPWKKKDFLPNSFPLGLFSLWLNTQPARQNPLTKMKQKRNLKGESNPLPNDRLLICWWCCSRIFLQKEKIGLVFAELQGKLIYTPQLLYNNNAVIQKNVLAKQSCCIQTKIYRSYRKMTKNDHFFLYNVYSFVWIQHFSGPPLNLVISETVLYLEPSYKEIPMLFQRKQCDKNQRPTPYLKK